METPPPSPTPAGCRQPEVRGTTAHTNIHMEDVDDPIINNETESISFLRLCLLLVLTFFNYDVHLTIYLFIFGPLC